MVDPALDRPGVRRVVDLEVDRRPVLVAELQCVFQIEVGPHGERQAAQVAAALGIEELAAVIELGRQGQAAPAVGHDTHGQPEGEGIGAVGLEVMGPVLGQRAVEDVAAWHRTP